MLRSKEHARTGKAWGYEVARERFILNVLAVDALGQRGLILGQGRCRTLEYGRYMRGRAELMLSGTPGEGNRAMRRMSALYGVECWQEQAYYRMAGGVQH